MKQTDVTVTFYLKKSEMNDEGHCPVMAKLVVGKFSEAAFSAKMSVPCPRRESCWKPCLRPALRQMWM